jgi:hypothetical protein
MKLIYAPTIGGLPGVVFDGAVKRLAWELDNLDGGLAAGVAALGERFVSEVYPHFSWKKARDKAIAMHRAGELEFFCPTGHSWGCYKIIQMAEDLGKHGIKVRYIGAIDPTAGPVMDVPANVEEVGEFWASRGPCASARRRNPDGSAGGRYRYPHRTKHTVTPFESGHIELGSNAIVHTAILKAVRALA